VPRALIKRPVTAGEFPQRRRQIKPMTWLARIFTWWNGQTLNTALHDARPPATGDYNSWTPKAEGCGSEDSTSMGRVSERPPSMWALMLRLKA
jgi:hypothetical protein